MYLPQSKLRDWREENAPRKCPILEDRSSDWVVDHNHRTGMVRGVISRVGNSLIGKVENFLQRRVGAHPRDFPRILRNIADYLERGDTDVLHPVGLTQLTKRFRNNLTSSEQTAVLRNLGGDKERIDSCRNATHRSQYYRQLTKETHESKHTTKATGNSVIPQSPKGAD